MGERRDSFSLSNLNNDYGVDMRERTHDLILAVSPTCMCANIVECRITLANNMTPEGGLST